MLLYKSKEISNFSYQPVKIPLLTHRRLEATHLWLDFIHGIFAWTEGMADQWLITILNLIYLIFNTTNKSAKHFT